MLSVVVPVYNVEKYLKESLESLHKQHASDVEFLIVNDGSTDNSQLIIDEYVKKDNRFKSYIKENGGLSDARNFVLPYAKGEYIFYFDSDDLLADNALDKICCAIKDKPDCVLFDFLFFWENSSKTKIVYGKNKNVDDYTKSILLSSPSANNKVFRKELLEKNMFPVGLYYEDVASTPIMIAQCNTFNYINEPLYLYRQRTGSIIYTYSEKNKDIFKGLNRIIEYYKNNGLFEKHYDELEYFCIEHLLLNGNRRFFHSGDCKQLFKESQLYIDKYFNNCLKNKYFRDMNKNDRLFVKLAYKCRVNLLKILIGLKGLIK